MEYPILSKCEIRFTELTCNFYLPEIPPPCNSYGAKWQPLYIYKFNPYLWTIFFELDGKVSRFEINQDHPGAQFIGKFAKEDSDKPYVWIFPPPPGGISQTRFGHGNTGSDPIFQWVYQSHTDNYSPEVSETNLEAIFDEEEGYLFKHYFGDLVPIPYSVPVLPKVKGTFPGMIGCIAVLMDQRATSNAAVMEGAVAFAEAVKDEINQLIADFEHDFTDYINALDYSEPPEVTFPEEALEDLIDNIINRVREAIVKYYLEKGLFYLLLHLPELDNPDIQLGLDIWQWNSGDLQDGNVVQLSQSTRYKQQFDETWPIEIPIQCSTGVPYGTQGTGTVTFQLKGRVTAEKVKCFVASAALGNSAYPKLSILRNWRDEILRRYKLGHALIKIYYRSSPPLARIVSRSKLLRKIICLCLNPIIKVLYCYHPEWIRYDN